MFNGFQIRASLVAATAVAVFSSHAAAQGVVTVKDMSLGLAQAIAQGAVEQCRKDGFRVTATVMNRAGQVIVVLRDDGTSPHTVDTSRRKAYTAVALRRSTTELGQLIASNPGLAGLKDISGVIVLGGGLPVRVGNEVIGSVGVGGAPSADRAEGCAKAAIDQVADQLK
ncbi:MAG: GlcG/HbpS family heme-binding protein [Rhodoplanes sp.]